MSHCHRSFEPGNLLPALSRRSLLRRCGTGLASLGLASLLGDAGELCAAGTDNPLAPRKTHFPGRAKRVIHLFLNGGPSHVDTFDYKPQLQQRGGQELPVKLATERKTGVALASPFQFKQYGDNGTYVSELFEKTAAHLEDIAIVNSMHADVPNHEPSLLLMNCGESRLVRPSVGSWVVYGMGTENQNLPGFVALCPDGYPVKESQNWQSAFLPGVYQGTHINTRHEKIDQLIQHIRNARLEAPQQERQLALLEQLNRWHQESRAADPALEARIRSFELAARMQTEASDAFDISR